MKAQRSTDNGKGKFSKSFSFCYGKMFNAYYFKVLCPVVKMSQWYEVVSKADAFGNNKNILNCDERGEAGEISKKVFLKAFEIYIHATHYNTEEAFGCNQCPGELEKGEQEDDFENKREVHICDGIDMGNMQYATKGMVEEDLFQVPKVPSGVHYLYLFTPALNYLLSTFLTILHQHF